MKSRDILWAGLLSIAFIIVLNLLTNTLDTTANAWDFVYYIGLAKDGFHAEPLASPFAYRYLTPFLVHALTWTGLSIEGGFKLIAYGGAFSQLIGVFLFTKWVSGSQRSAFLALTITALSTYNVKFLLFDNFRPDHLAYALILLQTWFALERKFPQLLVTTLIASQIREFNLIPLIAFLFMADDLRERTRHMLASTLVILPAVLLPRLFIPVTERYEILTPTPQGLVTAAAWPFIPSVIVNFIFVIVAYFLPLFLLARPGEVRSAFLQLPKDRRTYLIGYTLLVCLLTLYGGTDFARFATFLFLPQIILLGQLEPNLSNGKVVFAIVCLVIFNRLWAHFPDWDVEAYRDFYGGFSLRLNIHTLYRILELTAFLLAGYAANRWAKRPEAYQ